MSDERSESAAIVQMVALLSGVGVSIAASLQFGPVWMFIGCGLTLFLLCCVDSLRTPK